MNNQNITISVIIIGYNTKNYLVGLLHSIKKQNISIPKKNIEIIYVDDGSNDGSIEIFRSFPLNFKKKHFRFIKNSGRNIATQKGVDMSENSWLLFLRSNVVLSSNIINEYVKSILKYSAVAFMGKIIYKSEDVVFEKYLNHKLRGINRFNSGSIIPYQYLIFGNCIVCATIFKKINLNSKLISYGGEELEFAFNLNALFPNQIRCCNRAAVTRINHPGFLNHLLRLQDFGANNFKLLNEKNKKQILGGFYFIYKIKIFKNIYDGLLLFSSACYKLKLPILRYYFLRSGLLSAIIKGFWNSK